MSSLLQMSQINVAEAGDDTLSELSVPLRRGDRDRVLRSSSVIANRAVEGQRLARPSTYIACLIREERFTPRGSLLDRVAEACRRVHDSPGRFRVDHFVTPPLAVSIRSRWIPRAPPLTPARAREPHDGFAPGRQAGVSMRKTRASRSISPFPRTTSSKIGRSAPAARVERSHRAGRPKCRAARASHLPPGRSLGLRP